MLLVYTPEIKPRLKYIFDLILNEILGISYKLTVDQEHFIDFIGPKFNYSQEQIAKELFVYADGLLLEKGIHPKKIEKQNYLEQTVIFANNLDHSLMPFDLFSASFYLVSRYEEYLEFEPDLHGRFPAKASIAYQSGFLQKPVVNIWAKHLFDLLQKEYPRLESKPEYGYSFAPSYDIDIAFSYISKGIMRTIGGYLRNLKQLDFTQIKDRTKVLLTNQKDPYDTFKYQQSIHEKYKVTNANYFFLLGEYGAHDKNISTDRRRYQNLMQSLNDQYDVGIHPSYKSNLDDAIVEKELNLLSTIVKKEIIRSRQHYLKLHLPHTYQTLVDLEITKDYSMGFPDALGFRAGIASSFNFYLLSREIRIPLRVYPFCIMDVTMRDYKKLSIEKSIQQIKEIVEEVKKVDGLLSTVWHNHSLSEIDGWDGWRAVYEALFEYAT